ncbi:hypothetical protein GE21DRAFT_1222479, partial [Neurospora crassa]
KKTYNTRDSLVVTDPTTSLALTGLSMGERTGSRVFQWVWSYVIFSVHSCPHIARHFSPRQELPSFHMVFWVVRRASKYETGRHHPI